MSKRINPEPMQEIEVFTFDGIFKDSPLAPKTILSVSGNTIAVTCERPLATGGLTESFRYTHVDGEWRESFADGRIHMESKRIVKEYGTGLLIVPTEAAKTRQGDE